jgi:hypothetical protein
MRPAHHSSKSLCSIGGSRTAGTDRFHVEDILQDVFAELVEANRRLMPIDQLWNWLLPDIFGLRRVTFWEALGLLALSRILFGGFSQGGGSDRHSGRGRRNGASWWKRPKTAAPFEAAPQVPPAPPT